VAAAQAGDREALEGLLRRHHDRLYAVCYRLTGNDADAADATQDAMIAVVRGLPRFDRRSRFATWSYRVAVNASLDELRRRRHRPEPRLEEEDRPAVWSGGSPGEVGPDSVAERLDIDQALRRLPADYRAAVVLRDLCGFDYAEIAAILTVPPGTVRSRIARGRAALANLLDPQGNPRDPPRRHTQDP